MAASLESLIALALGFSVSMRGASGTKQYPGQYGPQSYQFMGQQPYQADPMQGMPQMPLLSWGQQAAPMGVQMQQQQPQFAQPLQASSLLQPQPAASGAEDYTAEAATAAAALPQLQRGTASLSMQDVMGLVDSVHDLQRRTKGLEQQLNEAHTHEKQLNDMALAAQYRSTSVDQSARKLAQLAQTSVVQAQQSMDQEKVVLDDMKKRLADAEKEKVVLQQELSQTQESVKNLKNIAASSQRKEQEALHAEKAAEQQAKVAEARENEALNAQTDSAAAIARQQALIDRMRGVAPQAPSLIDLEARDSRRQGSLGQFSDSPILSRNLLANSIPEQRRPVRSFLGERP